MEINAQQQAAIISHFETFPSSVPLKFAMYQYASGTIKISNGRQRIYITTDGHTSYGTI